MFKFKKFKKLESDSLITDQGYINDINRHGDIIVIVVCSIIILMLLYLGLRLLFFS